MVGKPDGRNISLKGLELSEQRREMPIVYLPGVATTMCGR